MTAVSPYLKLPLRTEAEIRTHLGRRRWKADTSENVGKNWLVGTVIDCGADEAGRNWIVTTDNVRGSEVYGDAKSDAVFIAAAPTMAEALEGIIAALSQTATLQSDIDYCLSVARAAVALANGVSP